MINRGAAHITREILVGFTVQKYSRTEASLASNITESAPRSFAASNPRDRTNYATKRDPKREFAYRLVFAREPDRLRNQQPCFRKCCRDVEPRCLSACTCRSEGSKMRLVPDVGLVADPNPGAYFYYSGVEGIIGGTSWSTPVWAGFCALINEARAKKSLPPIGLLNPHMYPLIGGPCLKDITKGKNGKYKAGTGFDQVTGIGVPEVKRLIEALTR